MMLGRMPGKELQVNDKETAKALRAIAEWHRKQGHLGFMNFCLAGASKIEELNDFQNSQCAKLLEKLAASKRRERAAVRDIEGLLKACECGLGCYLCKPGYDCGAEERCKPKWRGPQEAGKGEAHD